LSRQIIKTQVMLVGQTSDYWSANSRSEGYGHRGRRYDKSRGTKSGRIGQRTFGTDRRGDPGVDGRIILGWTFRRWD